MADNLDINRRCQKKIKTPAVIENGNRILVTYLCWGCGSSISRYEATDLPMTTQEVWNLCPRCVALNKGENKGKDRRV